MNSSYMALDDAAMRGAAQVAPLDAHDAELANVVPPHQAGGRRKHRSRRQRSRRSQRNWGYPTRSKQRGGQAEFNAPYSLGHALPGINSQFNDENLVNSSYSQSRGAQGY